MSALPDHSLPQVRAFICDRGGQFRYSSTPLHPDSFGRGLEECLVPSDLPMLRRHWQDMLNTGSGFQVQAEFAVQLDESVSRWAVHAAPLRLVDNEDVYLVLLHAGLGTPKFGPDEAVRYRAVLNTAVDAIITIDESGVIVSSNPATTRMFGYTEQELQDRNISMLMPQPYRSEHDGYISRYLQTGRARIIGIGRQIKAVRRNGDEFLVHLAISEFNVSGRNYFTGIIRDLSDLERVQNQLLQSERLAAIGQMVTGLAHESRNALQRAQACLDILTLDLEQQPEQLDLARRARTALQDLHRLYEEVRGYASPIHLEFRDCDLSAIWRKEWENLSGLRRGREISLQEELLQGPPRCEVDIHRMEQVFRNILENSLHACGNNGCISVSTDNTELEGREAVLVRLNDDGPGMKSEAVQRMFEPFFTTRQKGTGLGMAIVQRLVHAHGGTIVAGNGQSGGAEISLVLPRRQPSRGDQHLLDAT
ncbi:MAG: Sensor protein FixL [Planctomycetota bacterium]